jgi:hypothetical protein
MEPIRITLELTGMNLRVVEWSGIRRAVCRNFSLETLDHGVVDISTTILTIPNKPAPKSTITHGEFSRKLNELLADDLAKLKAAEEQYEKAKERQIALLTDLCNRGEWQEAGA